MSKEREKESPLQKKLGVKTRPRTHILKVAGLAKKSDYIMRVFDATLLAFVLLAIATNANSVEFFKGMTTGMGMPLFPSSSDPDMDELFSIGNRVTSMFQNECPSFDEGCAKHLVDETVAMAPLFSKLYKRSRPFQNMKDFDWSTDYIV